MPKHIEFTDPDWRHSGVKVTFTPSANRLDFTGWYDTHVAIEGGSLTLGEFLQRLGITEKHVRKALREAASSSSLAALEAEGQA